ncbi:MAG: NTP transferase domain-containing protein [Rhodospirillales bacterium]|nr:NTP transferase domain-containing protein [Rhodospirillales bacterium]
MGHLLKQRVKLPFISLFCEQGGFLRGVILTAGSGRRLSTHNEERHKVLLPVNGRAIIDYTLEAFSQVGVTDLAIVIGYQGDAVKEPEGLAQNQHRHAGGENRCQIDHHPGPARPNQLDRMNEGQLGKKRREQGDQSGDDPAFQAGCEKLAHGIFHRHHRQRGEKGRAGHDRKHAHGRNLRPFAQAHRIGRIEHAGDDHQNVAGVEGQDQQVGDVATGGDNNNTAEGQHHARHLQRRHRSAIGQERTNQHKHRYGALQNTHIDAAGGMGGHVKQTVEGGVANHSHEREEPQVRLQVRPVAAHRLVEKDQQQQRDAKPAQGNNRHR